MLVGSFLLKSSGSSFDWYVGEGVKLGCCTSLAGSQGSGGGMTCRRALLLLRRSGVASSEELTKSDCVQDRALLVAK